MGSSGSGAADCGVGSIVWVRRRNGSWWPGKILGPEELSASHVMSPRSGTPVKLLGREDASVDWYNLEKSKRVKAFRCGEFDDCIERAESTHGLPIKKREKYARREDAILHALELEKKMLKRQGLLGVTSERKCSKSSVSLEKEPVTSSGSFGNDNAKLGNPKSQQHSNKLDTVRKDDIISSPLYLLNVKEESQLSQEDDISEATPRMRGLLDLGPRITPSKRNLSSSVSTYGHEKDAFDHTSQPLLTHDTIMGSTSQVNGKKSLDKKKRSNEGLSEDNLVKRRDKSRPLVQVLQNSAKLELFDSLLPDYGTNHTSSSGVEQMVAVSRAKQGKYVYLPTNSSDSVDHKELPSSPIEMPSSRFGEGNCRPQLGSFLQESASGFMNDIPSDSSDTDSSESDSNDGSSETEPDMNREMTVLSESNPYALGRPGPLEEYGNLSSEELEESAHSGDTIHQLPANNAVPRWKSKRKRNARNPRRRSMDTLDGKAFDFSKRTSRQNSSIMRNDVYTDDADWNGKDVGGPMVGSGYRGYPLSPGYSFKSPNMTRWADSAREDQNIWGRYWEDPQEYFDTLYVGRHRARSYLVEVDVQVQASYQKEPVPFVSLMSRLNGKAIIGHPIQIEKLDDGSTETLIVDFGNEASLYDGDTALPPAWRTARRTTNFRVRRPHMDIDEATEDLPFSPHKKGSSSRPPMDRKFPKKVSKSGQPSSQKRRRLSSIAGLHDSSKNQMMKHATTTVACIPVKLVFSRLLEKINRPPSKAVSNVVT